jgi:hypothetical protein
MAGPCLWDRQWAGSQKNVVIVPLEKLEVAASDVGIAIGHCGRLFTEVLVRA